MAVAASELRPSSGTAPGERRLAWLLRGYTVLFAAGALAFLLRPDATVADIDRLGAAVGLATMPGSAAAVASDLWLVLAVANMAALAACCGLAARDVRRYRALAYPVVVSTLTAGAVGLLLFVRWTLALPFLALAVVSLALAAGLLRALRRTPVAG